MPIEAKEKMRIAKLGDKNPSKRQDVREKMSFAKKGKVSNSPETCFKKGTKPWNYVGQSKEERDWCKNKRNRLKRAISKELGGHTFGDWDLLKKQYDYRCLCCGKHEPEIKLTEDHIVPLSKGGSDLIENIQPLCLKCNTKKQTKIIKY